MCQTLIFSKVKLQWGWGKRICNYSIHVNKLFFFVNESRVITLYFFTFLLKLNIAILITIGNMPIFDILKGQIYEGGGVKENAITM
jgi:hypothetical protein